MPHDFPAPITRNPVLLPDGTAHAGTVFLAAATDNPRLIVGDYTYASAHVPPDDWAFALAPYLYPFSPERLIIGRFCQIADGVRFITASANHRYDGVSCFPFAIFAGPRENRPSMPGPGADTVVGNDVWLGQAAMVLPGARIGDGAIVGAGAVVRGTVPPYAIVAGNPAQVVRMRFAQAEIARLLALAWWDWDIGRITGHEAEIAGGDIDALERAAP